MWRSKGRDLIFKCCRGDALSTLNQVRWEKSKVILFHTLHCSSFLFQNYKFFNTTSNRFEFDEIHNFTSQENVGNENPKVLLEENDERNGQNASFVSIKNVFDEQVESVVFVLKNSLIGSVKSSLDKMDLTLNEKFVIAVIETPFVPGENLIAFFKWALKRSDFSANSRVVACLVEQVIKTGLKKTEVFAMLNLVKDIGENEKGVLNTEILNQVIRLFWRLDRGKACLEVFNKFKEFGCTPNANSYYWTIEGLCQCSMYNVAWEVCKKMLDAGKLPDGKKNSARIISCFCKGNKGKEAHLVYVMAKKTRHIRIPVFSMKLLIRTLCREKETVELALDLLNKLPVDVRKRAIKLFSGVLSALCRIKDSEKAVKLLFEMINNGPKPTNVEFNLVITLLSMAGRMEQVIDLFKVMELKGRRPGVYTYCLIASGYAKAGQMEDAYRVLSEAKMNHVKLAPAASHILTQRICKLEEFNKALGLLNEMKDNCVQPTADEYNKMIRLLCLNALDWKTAEKLLEEMKENGLNLSGISQCLIRAVKELDEHKLAAETITP